jgi:tetratricopeptide (TPR) repeat protein
MKPGRNDPCPCGSGTKFKRCCGRVAPATAPPPVALTDTEISTLVALINRDQVDAAEQRTRVLLKTRPNAGMLWKILSVALMRQRKDALPALRRTTELMPHDAEAHGNLGAYLCDQGQRAAGLASLRRALEIQPHNDATLVDAANAMKALGQVRESLAIYQRALQINPRSAESHNNLGNAFLEISQCEEAVRHYQLALEIRPSDAEIHCNLGNAQRQLGLLGDAIASSSRAIAIDPTLSVAHNNLGLTLVALGRRTEAVASYRQALKLNPDYVEALNNLGNVLPELGERREALSLFARAIELDPTRAETHCNLGNLLFEFRRAEDAGANYRRALELEPGNTSAHAGLGAALRMQGQAADAETSCRAALTHDPNCVAALSLLGELRADRGQFSEATELFQRVIAIDPGYPFAFYSVATNRKMTSEDTAWLQGTEALLAKPLPLRHEISLRYALGKYFDDLKEYDEAFGNYRQANELTKRYGTNYDRAALTERVDRVIRSFDAASIRQFQSDGHTSDRPVFIVGMPRSGTSLTEQILASHPAVFGAGELSFWQTAFTAFESAGLKGHGAASLIPGLARDYLNRLRALSGDAQRVVDKMPLNFINVGLICSAFPRARIIHLRRHPIDTCLSIYFQYFSHLHPYANDFDNLAHYYSQYVRVTDHWRASLPATTLLEIPYEALIEDQEQWSRRMLDFIGLPWDPKCLDFHQTDRVVITLSKWQVRQKIHASSAGRWRNYEKFVGPLQRLMSCPNSH